MTLIPRLRRDRFELFIAGREIAKRFFSELNDPEGQGRSVLGSKMAEKAAGDEEAMPLRRRLVLSRLNMALPPTAG